MHLYAIDKSKKWLLHLNRPAKNKHQPERNRHKPKAVGNNLFYLFDIGPNFRCRIGVLFTNIYEKTQKTGAGF